MSSLERPTISKEELLAIAFGYKPEQLKYIDKIEERFAGVLRRGFELALNEGQGGDAFGYVTCEAKNAAIKTLELSPEESDYLSDYAWYAGSAQAYEERFIHYDKLPIWDRLLAEYMCCDITKEKFLERYQEVKGTMIQCLELEKKYRKEQRARRTFLQWLTSKLHD